MKYLKKTVVAVTGVVLLAGCAEQPMGPTVAVMPGRSVSCELSTERTAVYETTAPALVEVLDDVDAPEFAPRSTRWTLAGKVRPGKASTWKVARWPAAT